MALKGFWTMKSSLAIALFLGALIAAPHPAECKWSRGKAGQHAEKAENHYKSGRYDLAVQEFNNAYKLGGDFNMLYYIARSHSKARNYQKSIIFYTRFLQEGGKKISNTKRRAVEREIQKLRGMASFKFRDKADQATETGDADEDGSLSGAMAKQKSAAYVDQGNRYKARQKFEAARKAYAKAYSLFPDYRTLYPLGMCEVRVGRISEARETYKRFLKDGGAAISPFTRQEIEKELARLEDAIAKKSNEERSLSFIKEARSLYGEGAFAQSLAKLDQAYQIYPNPEYLYEIARTAIQINDYQKAIESFRQYLAATHGTLPRARQTEVSVEVKRLENLLDTERRKKEACLICVSKSNPRACKSMTRPGPESWASVTTPA